MAIEFDNATNGGLTNPGTSLTFSYTVGTGSDRILFVGVESNVAISGVTYAGTAMTLIDSSQNGTDLTAYLFYLIAPSTGANNVVISAGSSGVIGGHASSYKGAKQSGVPDSTAKNTVNNNATYSISTTTVADNSWVVGYARESAGRLMTASAGTTMRAEVDDGHGKHMFDSGGAVTPAGVKTLGGTIANAANWAGVVASFAPAVAASTNSNFFQFM